MGFYVYVSTLFDVKSLVFVKYQHLPFNSDWTLIYVILFIVVTSGN